MAPRGMQHRAKRSAQLAFRGFQSRSGDTHRYQLFLSDVGKVSCGFRYWKNHPADAVATKPKPTRRTTVIRTPKANVIMLPPWSYLFCVQLTMPDSTQG